MRKSDQEEPRGGPVASAESRGVCPGVPVTMTGLLLSSDDGNKP